MGLLDSLGLDQVSGDPNDIPDGPYKGLVVKSEIVVTKKDEVKHAITYKVSEGPHKGAERAEWFTLGKDPVREGPGQVLVGFTPTMSDQAKTYYKKRWADLGVISPNHDGPMPSIEALLNIPVEFGVKTREGFKNVNWVNRRTDVQPPVGTNPTPGTSVNVTPPSAPQSAEEALASGQL